MNRRLYKSRSKKSVSGVCGGLEDYLNLDVTIIRLVWVLVTIATGIFPGIIAYVAAALIIPDEPADYNYNNSGYHANEDEDEDKE